MTGNSNNDPIADEYLHNASGPRVNTDLHVYASLQRLHPEKHITMTPSQTIMGFEESGKLKIVPAKTNATKSGPLVSTQYSSSSRKEAKISEHVLFGRHLL